KYNVIFRIVHHYRKVQGLGRAGRGSQEISGSFVLGAWGENSLFFEPRKHGAVRIEVQSKDSAPTEPFRLVIESEVPRHAPTRVRLRVEEDRSGDDLAEKVVQVSPALPQTQPLTGKPGVAIEAIAQAVGRSVETLRKVLKPLRDDKRVVVTGQAAKGKALF